MAAESFAEAAAPGGLKACKTGLGLLLRRVNLEENRYENELWLHQNGSLAPVDTGGRVAAFWWLNEESLLFTRPGEGEDTESTRLFRLNLSGPGKAEEHALLPHEAEDVFPLPGGGLIYLARENRPPLPAGAEERDRQDYEVLTGFPFTEDGTGFTCGKPRRLWLWQGGGVRALTEGTLDVEDARFCAENARLYYTARRTGVQGPGNELWALDTNTLAAAALPLPAQPFACHVLCPAGAGRLLVFGSNMLAHGLNQNGAFYRLDFPQNQYTPLYEGGEHTCWSAVNCDMQQGAGPQLHVWQGRGWFISTQGGAGRLFSIGLEAGDIRPEAAPEGSLCELAFTEDGPFFVALQGLSPPELFGPGPGGPRQLSSWNRTFAKTHSLAQPQPLPLRRAGLPEIEGWLLRPAGFLEEKLYPAVLVIHGGPKTVYGPVLHHEMQYMAAEGFAVLFCNPRGSCGRGDDFADIRGRYGREDQTDLLAFLDAALAQNPWIDPQRVGVWGGSYGGYMVNRLIGQTGRFAAAVSERGIANWASMAALSDIGPWFVPDQAADPWETPAAAWENSPLKEAHRATAPTLFLHGAQDGRCPPAESLQMYAALRRRGVPARLCLFNGESHELPRAGKPRHRVVRLREIAAWLAEWL